MKIIFDSEEQKKKFFKNMAHALFCPSSVGLNDGKCDLACIDACHECWQNAIESEVKEQ